jgi:hypothetical protein
MFIRPPANALRRFASASSTKHFQNWESVKAKLCDSDIYRRCLRAKSLMRIAVPVPNYSDQLQFDIICEKAGEARRIQAEAIVELKALLPSILHRAFAGEL